MAKKKTSKKNIHKKKIYKKSTINTQIHDKSNQKIVTTDKKEINQDKQPKSSVGKTFLILIVFVLLFLVVVWLLITVSQKKVVNSASSSTEASSTTTSGDSTSVEDSASEGSESEEEESEQNWNAVGPIMQTVDAQLISPDYRMIALPENGRVDINYFENVTFVGDSITQGFSLYTKTLPAKYCAYKNISPKGIYDGSTWVNQNDEEEVPLDAIVATQPDKVYILIGANAIGTNTNEAFIQYYTEMINQIKARLDPSVKYYIQSITPVRPDSKFDQARINELNNLLAQLAYQQGVYFVDLSEPLAGDDGYLREEYAGYDGIHMLAPGYDAWIDYLVTHTAYDKSNPYLEGSPAYTTET